MDAKTQQALVTMGAGLAKKVLMLQAAGLVSHGVMSSNYTEVFVSLGMAAIGAGWSFWNDYGKAILFSQLEVLKAKSLAQAEKMRNAGVTPVTVTQIAMQSDKMNAADVTKAVASLPAEVKANIIPLAKVLMLLVAVSMLLFGSGDASAEVKLGRVGQKIADDLAGTKSGAAPSLSDSALSKLMSAVSKPFQDLAAFINSDAEGAAALATTVPGLQDTNGRACWQKMQDAGAVFKAHPVPVTLKLMTDFEALRLLQMTSNNLCSYTPCTVVFSDGQNLATAVASAVGGVLASSAVPSLTTICARIPQLSPMLPEAVTGVPAAPAAK